MFTISRLSRLGAQRSFLSSRTFTTSIRVRNAGTVSLSVAEETQDVTTIDALLKVVKQRSNPEYHSIMPMRTPSTWSEARLKMQNGNEKTKVDDSTTELHSLPPRNMHDSYTEFILPFGSDPKLLEEYTNAAGGIRTGKLMEHLDSLAGSISYKHVLGPGVESLGQFEETGFYIVTASVERLDMLGHLNPERDLRLSGQVIYTGRSSMEVVVKMETIPSQPSEEEETILLGRFSMVCRDAHTHRAREINPLIISTSEEHTLYSMGQDLKRKRQCLAQRSLSRVPPSSTEAAALHSYYLKYGQENQTTPDIELVSVGDTRVEKCMLMFPQERNVHQKIFGGYLMRLAYELGFANVSMFCKGGVRFLSLDQISFRKPVPIGSILRLTSCVLHSTTSTESPQLLHVGVTANVVDIKTGTEETTNEFRFTWQKEPGEGEEQNLRTVVPKTYKEAMLWLEGRRALEMGDEIRRLRKKH